MIAKEWRNARWKFFVGTLLALAAGAVTPFGVGPIAWEGIGVPPFPMLSTEEGRYLVWWEWFGTGLGNPILFFLAVVLGADVISGEVRSGNIFLLLSKPISRERVLLTKYLVGAGVLFVVTVLFSAALLITAGITGYLPNVGGLLISTVLMWLGLLFVLGTALTLSVVFNSTLLALVGTVLVWLLTSIVPAYVFQQIAVMNNTSSSPLQEGLSLSMYWSSETAYLDANFPAVEFFVCLVSSLLVLAAALWLFDRKAY